MAQTSRDFGEFLRRSLVRGGSVDRGRRGRPGLHLESTRAGAVLGYSASATSCDKPAAPQQKTRSEAVCINRAGSGGHLGSAARSS